MKEFKAKVCVITGSGSGIGRALSLDLARRGARLALSDVNGEAAAATAEACRSAGAPEAESFPLDVSDRTAVFAHADDVRGRFGRVNLVINNAGVALHKTVLDTPIEDYEWIVGINFWGVLYGTKAFLPHLIASGDGHVVNLSSLFGLIAVPSESGYNATKFAVRGFTEAVHPGGIRTNIARSARVPAGEEEDLASSFDKVAFLSPEDAAAIILRGVERNRARIIVGKDARALDLMQRVLGSGYQAIVRRAAGRAERRH
jgi:short-subunit dehydrogenase